MDPGSPLFGPDVPAGFRYRPDFVTADEEAALAAEIARVEFAAFEMRGVIAKRRVAFFGRSYDGNGRTTPPIPAFLLPFRDRLAGWIGIAPDDFAMALINEYREGAPIGWHRDAPQYDLVAGISLLSECRMKLRPYVPPKALAAAQRTRRAATHEITLEPRSAYLLSGEARTAYEHHIPPAPSLRYSITLRTLRP
jgi:alkylated DNA repair dioxygenase AlkB